MAYVCPVKLNARTKREHDKQKTQSAIQAVYHTGLYRWDGMRMLTRHAGGLLRERRLAHCVIT